MDKILAKLNELLDAAKRSPLYPDRKVINGAVAGAVASVVAAVGLAASPFVAALAALVVAEATAYLSKPAARDIKKRIANGGSVKLDKVRKR